MQQPGKQKKTITNKQSDRIFSVIKIAVALLIAMTLAFIIILLVSKEPVSAIRYFLLEPLSSARHIGNLFENSIPLVFSGLSLCLMFSAGVVTLSAEGVIYFGALVTSVIALYVPLPGKALTLVAILVASVIGGAMASIPVLASRKFKTDPFVFSLLFNFVLLYTGSYILNYFLKDVSYNALASRPFPEDTLFHTVVKGTGIHSGIFIAAVCVFLTWLFLYKTRWGYNARLIKNNKNFAKYVGVHITLTVVLVQFLGGMMAATGGAVEMFGKNTRFMWTALPGYGWDGFLVATLAYYNPLMVPLAAVFLGYIRTGADIMNRYTDVANEVVTIIQSVMILLIASKALLGKLQQRIRVKQAKSREEEVEAS